VTRLLSRPFGFAAGSILVVVSLGIFYWYQNLRYQAVPAGQRNTQVAGDEPAP
jgi:hypothetical protein